MRFTSCIPALGMLTFQLVSLSKPVGPSMNSWALPLSLQGFQNLVGLFSFRNKCRAIRSYSAAPIGAFGVTAPIPNAGNKGTPKSIPKKVLPSIGHTLHLPL